MFNTGNTTLAFLDNRIHKENLQRDINHSMRSQLQLFINWNDTFGLTLRYTVVYFSLILPIVRRWRYSHKNELGI